MSKRMDHGLGCRCRDCKLQNTIAWVDLRLSKTHGNRIRRLLQENKRLRKKNKAMLKTAMGILARKCELENELVSLKGKGKESR